mmetsp:Transcript_42463/g.76513  ORF Transcript_42463/g.76513 Transcript_42463/m.76513 type:complete len:81 (-) Transcript_42463:19-261(-)
MYKKKRIESLAWKEIVGEGRRSPSYVVVTGVVVHRCFYLSIDGVEFALENNEVNVDDEGAINPRIHQQARATSKSKRRHE